MAPQTSSEQYTEQVQKQYGGPLGLGDPEDRSLRKVEREVLIPQIMRDRGKAEKCVAEVKAFEACCKESSLFMIVKCRNENSLLKSCLSGWYNNKEFIGECTEIYLKERSMYRRTGLQKKYRKYVQARADEMKQKANVQ